MAKTLITVKNLLSSGDIAASINKWGRSGATGYYMISSGKTEAWHRWDERAYILSLQVGAVVLEYPVWARNVIEVHPDPEKAPFFEVRAGEKGIVMNPVMNYAP